MKNKSIKIGICFGLILILGVSPSVFAGPGHWVALDWSQEISQGFLQQATCDEDDNIIVVGHDFSTYQGIVMKQAKTTGGIIWQTRTGGIFYSQNYFSVDLTSSGYIIAGGYRQKINSYERVAYFQKYNPNNGNVLQWKIYQGPSGTQPYCNNLIVNGDYTYATLNVKDLASGYGQGILLKLDTNTLNIVGSLTRFSPVQFFYDVTVDSQGYILVAGVYVNTRVESGYDTFILRCDSSLNVIDEYILSCFSAIYDRPNALTVDSQNNIFVAGTKIIDGEYYPYLVKLNSSGAILWQQESTSSWAVPTGEFRDVAMRYNNVIVAHVNTPFNTQGGEVDAFHAVMYNGATGSQMLSIINENELNDPYNNYESHGVAVDSTGAIIVCGFLDKDPQPEGLSKMVTRRYITNIY